MQEPQSDGQGTPDLVVPSSGDVPHPRQRLVACKDQGRNVQLFQRNAKRGHRATSRAAGKQGCRQAFSPDFSMTFRYRTCKSQSTQPRFELQAA